MYVFVTQVTSVTPVNAIFLTQKCDKFRVLRCNSLSVVAFSSNYFHFEADTHLLFTKNDTFREVLIKTKLVSSTLRTLVV